MRLRSAILLFFALLTLSAAERSTAQAVRIVHATEELRDGRYVAHVMITNMTSTAISDWKMTFELNSHVEHIEHVEWTDSLNVLQRLPHEVFGQGWTNTILPGVFNNLIKNAAEHVADLESEAQRSVYIACAQTVDAVTVRIQNGGEPIAPERLALFFDKFNTTKVNTGRTGLGTSYARLVARAHGGSVSVSSDSSNGTVVDVVLPLED